MYFSNDVKSFNTLVLYSVRYLNFANIRLQRDMNFEFIFLNSIYNLIMNFPFDRAN